MLAANVIKNFIIFLLVYSVLNILILFTPFTSIQANIYSFSTFGYKQLLNYPHYYGRLNFKNYESQKFLEQLLENEKKYSYLNEGYWKNKFTFTSNNEIRSNAFYNMLVLLKNNKIKRTKLKDIYFKNLKFFSDSYSKKITDKL